MNTFKQLRSLNWVVVVAGLCLAGQSALADDRASFQGVVAKNFDRWTQGSHGVLTSERTKELVLRADIRGEEAAALAAIHAYQKKSGASQPLSRQSLITRKPEDPTLRRDQAASGANISRNFGSFARHIQSAPRRLFAVERPSVDTLTQGNLGDCYFVAAVGGLAHTDPSRILQMIKQNRDRSFEVHFPSGQQVTVPALTDAQLALSSNAGQQGVWLNVLEIAAGIVRRDSKTTELPLDNIGSGGDSAFSIRLLTGHSVDKFRIRHKVNGEFPAPDEKEIDALAVRLTQLIRTHVKRQELICCSTGNWAVPPGISKTHEYAVLGLKDGHVDLWNPWGYKYNFAPKGKPGYANGFYFEGGRCSMPIRDFVRIFGRLAIERQPDVTTPVNQVARLAPIFPAQVDAMPTAPAQQGPVPIVPIHAIKFQVESHVAAH